MYSAVFLQNDHTYGLLMTKIQWIEQIIVSPIYCFKQNTVHTLAFNMHLFNFSLLTCYGCIMLCSD